MEGLMLDEKVARVRKLIEQRDKINAELATLLGVSEPSRRGRPRKPAVNDDAPTDESQDSGSGGMLPAA